MSFMRFSKMHGAGNDFIIVDQTHSVRKFTPERIQRLCDRHKGIGADGLILLSKSSLSGQDNNCVHMDFYNCDGSRAELCGNGLRCAAAFAYQRCLAPGSDITFVTGCGTLRTKVLSPDRVRIELPYSEQGFRKVEGVVPYPVYAGVVGVPHAVVFVPDAASFDVDTVGAAIRNHEAFQPDGTNVDFLPQDYDLSAPVQIRTFERGVEGETPACGTGSGASAAVLRLLNPDLKKVTLLTRSEDLLDIEFPEDLSCMYLTGPAEEAFHGATGAFDLE